MAEPGGERRRVGVVAPNPLARRIGAVLLRDGIDVAAHAAAVGDLAPEPFDIVVLHLDPRSATSAELEEIVRREPCAPVVCIVPEPVWKGTRLLLRHGASSVVAEDEIDRSLGAAVSAAHAGQLTLPGRLRREIAQPVLSAREKQMLAMVVMGFTNPEISRKLHVTESTVKSHLTSAFAKLGVRSRNEATALILDPANGLGTGILEISGSATANDTIPAPREWAPATVA